jgi:hypothetical protein
MMARNSDIYVFGKSATDRCRSEINYSGDSATLGKMKLFDVNKITVFSSLAEREQTAPSSAASSAVWFAVC